MQHYLDFEGYPLGDLTAQDWSAYQDSSSMTASVVNSGGAEGQIMEVEVTVSPVRWLAWDGPGQPTDVEIYIRQRLDVFRYSHGVFFRGQPGGDFLAAVMDLQADQFILSGSGVAAPETVVQGDIWHMVVRANGGDVMGKAWKDGSVEPSGWLINQAASVTSAGRLGVISDDSGIVPYYEFGVGTAGDPAPRAPLGGAETITLATATAPVSTLVQSIEATSLEVSLATANASASGDEVAVTASANAISTGAATAPANGFESVVTTTSRGVSFSAATAPAAGTDPTIAPGAAGGTVTLGLAGVAVIGSDPTLNALPAAIVMASGTADARGLDLSVIDGTIQAATSMEINAQPLYKTRLEAVGRYKMSLEAQPLID